MFAGVVAEVAQTDDAALVQQLRELEGRRREVEAETAAVLSELDRAHPWRRASLGDISPADDRSIPVRGLSRA